MNKKTISIICYFVIMYQLCQTATASHYAPNVYYARPSKDEPHLANPSITFTAGFANEAYNRNGQSVPFLQQYGKEDFLLRFIDPSLGPDNLESAGQGLISGKYHFKQLNFVCEKNIFHKLLIGFITSFQDLSITEITPKFIYEEASLLPSQVVYLEKLEQVTPKSINTTGMNTTIFYIVYNERHSDFNHIDYFDTFLFAGISTPQAMKNENISIFQHALSANIYFGYPLIGAITVGVNNWFHLGLTGLVVPFQDAQTTIPINKTGENNHLLFSQTTQARIKQSPFFSGTIYIELTKPESKATGTIAYSYSQYLDSTITPIDTRQFSTAHANKAILLDGYDLGALLFELEIDCSSDTKKLAPIVSMFFSMPITGRFYPKAYIFGSECNLQISYNF